VKYINVVGIGKIKQQTSLGL